MNENEIITALEDAVSRLEKTGIDDWELALSKDTTSAIIDIIKILKEENEELKRRNQNLTFENENLTSALKSAKAEIERLHHILVSFMSEVENWEHKYNIDTSSIPRIAVLGTEKGSIIKHIASEARKELAERLREKGTSPELDEGKYYSDYDIDRTLAEMESEWE